MTDLLSEITQHWNDWGAPKPPAPLAEQDPLLVENNDWYPTGRTCPGVTPSGVTTRGDGRWEQYLGDANGREVWESIRGLEVNPNDYFYYWNGSQYIEFVYVPQTEEMRERLLHGDQQWLLSSELVAQRETVLRLMQRTGAQALMQPRPPRPYSEVGAPNGNQEGPWYKSPVMYLWLVGGTIYWFLFSHAAYQSAITNQTNDAGDVGFAIVEGFMFGTWLFYVCALAAAMFRVNTHQAKILTTGIVAGVIAHGVKNKIEERQGLTNPDGSWK